MCWPSFGGGIRTAHGVSLSSVREAGRLETLAARFDFAEPLARRQLRKGGDVGHGVDRRGGDAQLLGGVVDLLLGARGGPLAERREHLAEARRPVHRHLQLFVLEQVEALHQDEQVRVRHQVEEVDEAVGALRIEAAGSLLDDALVRPRRREPGVVVERGFLVRDLDALAVARVARVPEAGQRRHAAVQPGMELRLEPWQRQRRPRRVAGDVVVAARRPLRERARLPVGARTAPPIGRDRDNDGGGVRRLQRGIEAIGCRAAFAVQDDVGVPRQLGHTRVVDRQLDAQLVLVQVVEERALAAHKRRLAAHRVAVRRLALDHLRAEIREQLPAVRPGYARRELEDDDI